VIELRDVTVRFGALDAVHDVSLTVGSGEWLALIGPNGAGKTSLLRAMCRLVAFHGDIELDGQSVRRLSRRELARVIAFVPQTPVTPHELTVAEYVLLGRTPYLAYLGDESRADRLAAQRALDRLELLPFADRPLGSLSGGELQRAVLARALAQEAPILMLDEPTTALDLGRQQQALELIDSLRGDGLTVVSTLHDLTLAGQYADRLVLLDRGAVVAQGLPEDVLSVQNLESYYDASVRVVREEGRVFVLPLRR
jgi:iron complex transport system ATP-binding protein